HRFEVFAGVFAEKLSDAWQSFDDRLILWHLTVEHAQGIRHRPSLTVLAHPSDHRLQRLTQRLVELDAIGGRPYRVQFEIPVCNPEAVEEGGEHLQNFRIPRRRLAASGRRPDDLSIDLIELPIAALLRALTPEHRADAIKFIQS